MVLAVQVAWIGVEGDFQTGLVGRLERCWARLQCGTPSQINGGSWPLGVFSPWVGGVS